MVKRGITVVRFARLNAIQETLLHEQAFGQRVQCTKTTPLLMSKFAEIRFKFLIFLQLQYTKKLTIEHFFLLKQIQFEI